MGRINLETEDQQEINLDKLIPQYAFNKSELDSYKSICDKENQEIKKALEQLGVDEYCSDGYTVKRVVAKKESYNEALLLEVVKKHGINVVKTTEYVDMDALESYLYNNLMTQELAADIEKCRKVTEVVQLRLSKAKKSKED